MESASNQGCLFQALGVFHDSWSGSCCGPRNVEIKRSAQAWNGLNPNDIKCIFAAQRGMRSTAAACLTGPSPRWMRRPRGRSLELLERFSLNRQTPRTRSSSGCLLYLGCAFSPAWIPSFKFPARLFSRLLSGKPDAVQSAACKEPAASTTGSSPYVKGGALAHILPKLIYECIPIIVHVKATVRFVKISHRSCNLVGFRTHKRYASGFWSSALPIHMNRLSRFCRINLLPRYRTKVGRVSFQSAMKLWVVQTRQETLSNEPRWMAC